MKATCSFSLMRWIGRWLSLCSLSSICSAPFFASADALKYSVSSTLPHHPGLFTQGLQFYNGYLYESAGNYGQSTLQIVHPDTGKIVLQRKLDAKYFGESDLKPSLSLTPLVW
jgi:glutamine cyclotransferase